MNKTVSLGSALLCTFIWGTTFIAMNVVPQIKVHNNALPKETVLFIC